MPSQFFKQNFKYYTYFYRYLSYRIFITFILNISVGLLDGFGLVMFLPLLQMASGEGKTNPNDLGNLQFLVDGMEAAGLRMILSNILLIMLLFFVLKGIARFVESYYKTIVQNYFIKTLRFESIDKLSQLSYKSFVSEDSGRIQNTLSAEVGRVVGAYNSYFMAVQGGIMVAVYSFLAFLANPQFAILVAIGGVLSNWLFKFINIKTQLASRNITHEGHIYQGLLIQKVAFYKYLKATGLMKPFAQRLKKSVENIERSNKEIGLYNSILYASREPLIIGVVVVVILVQTTYFEMSMGLILLSLLFFYRALTFLMSLQGFWNTFLMSSGALENIQDFMQTLHKNREKKGKESLIRFEQSIRMDKVSFSYGNNPVLREINLNVFKNETLAFVGESGSGKTTLVNIIAGLMPVDQGCMEVDGIPYDQLDIRTLQHRIGYITQEPVIFSDTVYNNVTFWAPKTPENINRFWQALEKASIADFVRSLNQVEEAPLGSNGILVSGGQKQRISIARELFKEVDILIMDEATSALDSETEKMIQENIEQLKGHYTILIVAHRLATVKHADRIVLLSQGQIKGMSNFEGLLKQSPDFKRMVALQEF